MKGTAKGSDVKAGPTPLPKSAARALALIEREKAKEIARSALKPRNEGERRGGKEKVEPKRLALPPVQPQARSSVKEGEKSSGKPLTEKASQKPIEKAARRLSDKLSNQGVQSTGDARTGKLPFPIDLHSSRRPGWKRWRDIIAGTKMVTKVVTARLIIEKTLSVVVLSSGQEATESAVKAALMKESKKIASVGWSVEEVEGFEFDERRSSDDERKDVDEEDEDENEDFAERDDEEEVDEENPDEDEDDVDDVDGADDDDDDSEDNEPEHDEDAEKARLARRRFKPGDEEDVPENEDLDESVDD